MTNKLADLTPAEQHLIHTATARLKDEFAGTFNEETIERFITDSSDKLLPNATVTAFVPIFVERFARDRLGALAKVQGHTTTGAPSVLFLCVHNAGRSQIAAGWMRHLAGDAVTVYSGGSTPSSEINPAAVDAMAEVGIDIGTEFPKPWTDEIVRAADVVVTMGCGDACPVYPGKRYEDWDVPDPQGLLLAEIRPIRDDIEARVRQLLTHLDTPSTSNPA